MIHGLAPRSTIHGLVRHLPGQHDQKSHAGGGAGAAPGKFKATYGDEYDAMEAHAITAQQRAARRDPESQEAIAVWQSRD